MNPIETDIDEATTQQPLKEKEEDVEQSATSKENEPSTEENQWTTWLNERKGLDRQIRLEQFFREWKDKEKDIGIYFDHKRRRAIYTERENLKRLLGEAEFKDQEKNWEPKPDWIYWESKKWESWKSEQQNVSPPDNRLDRFFQLLSELNELKKSQGYSAARKYISEERQQLIDMFGNDHYEQRYTEWEESRKQEIFEQRKKVFFDWWIPQHRNPFLSSEQQQVFKNEHNWLMQIGGSEDQIIDWEASHDWPAWLENQKNISSIGIERRKAQFFMLWRRTQENEDLQLDIPRLTFLNMERLALIDSITEKTFDEDYESWLESQRSSEEKIKYIHKSITKSMEMIESKARNRLAMMAPSLSQSMPGQARQQTAMERATYRVQQWEGSQQVLGEDYREIAKQVKNLKPFFLLGDTPGKLPDYFFQAAEAALSTWDAEKKRNRRLRAAGNYQVAELRSADEKLDDIEAQLTKETGDLQNIARQARKLLKPLREKIIFPSDPSSIRQQEYSSRQSIFIQTEEIDTLIEEAIAQSTAADVPENLEQIKAKFSQHRDNVEAWLNEEQQDILRDKELRIKYNRQILRTLFLQVKSIRVQLEVNSSEQQIIKQQIKDNSVDLLQPMVLENLQKRRLSLINKLHNNIHLWRHFIDNKEVELTEELRKIKHASKYVRIAFNKEWTNELESSNPLLLGTLEKSLHALNQLQSLRDLSIQRDIWKGQLKSEASAIETFSEDKRKAALERAESYVEIVTNVNEAWQEDLKQAHTQINSDFDSLLSSLDDSEKKDLQTRSMSLFNKNLSEIYDTTLSESVSSLRPSRGNLTSQSVLSLASSRHSRLTSRPHTRRPSVAPSILLDTGSQGVEGSASMTTSENQGGRPRALSVRSGLSVRFSVDRVSPSRSAELSRVGSADLLSSYHEELSAGGSLQGAATPGKIENVEVWETLLKKTQLQLDNLKSLQNGNDQRFAQAVTYWQAIQSESLAGQIRVIRLLTEKDKKEWIKQTLARMEGEVRSKAEEQWKSYAYENGMSAELMEKRLAHGDGEVFVQQAIYKILREELAHRRMIIKEMSDAIPQEQVAVNHELKVDDIQLLWTRVEMAAQRDQQVDLENKLKNWRNVLTSWFTMPTAVGYTYEAQKLSNELDQLEENLQGVKLELSSPAYELERRLGMLDIRESDENLGNIDKQLNSLQRSILKFATHWAELDPLIAYERQHRTGEQYMSSEESEEEMPEQQVVTDEIIPEELTEEETAQQQLNAALNKANENLRELHYQLGNLTFLWDHEDQELIEVTQEVEDLCGLSEKLFMNPFEMFEEPQDGQEIDNQLRNFLTRAEPIIEKAFDQLPKLQIRAYEGALSQLDSIEELREKIKSAQKAEDASGNSRVSEWVENLDDLIAVIKTEQKWLSEQKTLSEDMQNDHRIALGFENFTAEIKRKKGWAQDFVNHLDQQNKHQQQLDNFKSYASSLLQDAIKTFHPLREWGINERQLSYLTDSTPNVEAHIRQLQNEVGVPPWSEQHAVMVEDGIKNYFAWHQRVEGIKEALNEDTIRVRVEMEGRFRSAIGFLNNITSRLEELTSAHLENEELTHIVNTLNKELPDATKLFGTASEHPWSLENQKSIIEKLKFLEQFVPRVEVTIQSIEQDHNYRALNETEQNLKSLHERLTKLYSLGMHVIEGLAEAIVEQQKDCRDVMENIGEPPWSDYTHEEVKDRLKFEIRWYQDAQDKVNKAEQQFIEQIYQQLEIYHGALTTQLQTLRMLQPASVELLSRSKDSILKDQQQIEELQEQLRNSQPMNDQAVRNAQKVLSGSNGNLQNNEKSINLLKLHVRRNHVQTELDKFLNDGGILLDQVNHKELEEIKAAISRYINLIKHIKQNDLPKLPPTVDHDPEVERKQDKALSSVEATLPDLNSKLEKLNLELRQAKLEKSIEQANEWVSNALEKAVSPFNSSNADSSLIQTGAELAIELKGKLEKYSQDVSVVQRVLTNPEITKGNLDSVKSFDFLARQKQLQTEIDNFNAKIVSLRQDQISASREAEQSKAQAERSTQRTTESMPSASSNTPSTSVPPLIDPATSSTTPSSNAQRERRRSQWFRDAGRQARNIFHIPRRFRRDRDHSVNMVFWHPNERITTSVITDLEREKDKNLLTSIGLDFKGEFTHIEVKQISSPQTAHNDTIPAMTDIQIVTNHFGLKEGSFVVRTIEEQLMIQRQQKKEAFTSKPLRDQQKNTNVQNKAYLLVSDSSGNVLVDKKLRLKVIVSINHDSLEKIKLESDEQLVIVRQEGLVAVPLRHTERPNTAQIDHGSERSNGEKERDTDSRPTSAHKR